MDKSPLTLGRMASQIALVLMGKHKPVFDPSTDCGDYVVVTNSRLLRTTGDKMHKKLYYSHSTRPGSLKSMSMEKLMQKWGGGEILRRAVRGMLPKNKLRDRRLERLKSEYISGRLVCPSHGTECCFLTSHLHGRITNHIPRFCF